MDGNHGHARMLFSPVHVEEQTGKLEQLSGAIVRATCSLHQRFGPMCE
jgi:hypothetical protein